MRTIKVIPDSKAEEYLMNTLAKVCKDKFICRLGVLFGVGYNEYEFSSDDFDRMKEFIKSNKK